MTLGSFGLIAIAETRPLSGRGPSPIGLGPRGAQTVPLRLIASVPHTGCCHRDRWPAAPLRTARPARPRPSRRAPPRRIPVHRRPARPEGEPRLPERAPPPPVDATDLRRARRPRGWGVPRRRSAPGRTRGGSSPDRRRGCAATSVSGRLGPRPRNAPRDLLEDLSCLTAYSALRTP